MFVISLRSKGAAANGKEAPTAKITVAATPPNEKMPAAAAAPLDSQVHFMELQTVSPLKLATAKEVNAILFQKMLQNAANSSGVTEGCEDEDEKVANGGKKRAAKARTPRTFSAAAMVVKRMIQLSNLVRKNQADTHFGTVVADFLSRKGSLPKGSDTIITGCWDNAAEDTFHVRGKKFLCNSQKVKAGESRMKFIAAHWLKSDKREDNLAGRPNSIVQILTNKLQDIKGQTPFFFVINLQVPGNTTHSLTLYYMTSKRLEDDPLLLKFVNGDDEFRNSRFKLIPRVAQGSWFVKQAVGKTTCLIGRALTINYHTASNYMELDIDIGSSSVAKTVVGLVLGCLRNLVVEMAFLIQANTEEELPERLLGTCRLSYLDVDKAMPITVD